MTKPEMVKAIAQAAGINASQAEKAFEAVFDCIRAGLETEGRAAVHGFGVFVKAETAARKGRNPKTGEAIDIPAKSVIRFRQIKKAKQP